MLGEQRRTIYSGSFLEKERVKRQIFLKKEPVIAAAATFD